MASKGESKVRAIVDGLYSGGPGANALDSRATYHLKQQIVLTSTLSLRIVPSVGLKQAV